MIPPSWTRFSPLFSTLLLQTFETLFSTTSYRIWSGFTFRHFHFLSLFFIFHLFSSLFVSIYDVLQSFDTSFYNTVFSLQTFTFTQEFNVLSFTQRGVPRHFFSFFIIFHHFSSHSMTFLGISTRRFSYFFHHFFIIFFIFFIFSSFQSFHRKKHSYCYRRSLVPRSLLSALARSSLASWRRSSSLVPRSSSLLLTVSLPNLLSTPPYRNHPHPACSHMRVLRLHFDI